MRLTRRQSVLLAAAGAVCLCALALVLILFAGGEESPGKAQEDPAKASTTPPESSEDLLAREIAEDADAGQDENHHHDVVDPVRDRAIEAAARAFLEGYLPYEVGAGTGETSRTIRAASSPELAAQLLEAPPRFPPGLDRRPQPATLKRIQVVGAGQGPTSEPSEDRAGVLAYLDRSGSLEVATFELELIDGRWLVTGVLG